MWCEEPNENVLKTNGTKFYDKKEQKDIAHPERNKYWKEVSMFLYCFSLFNSEQSEGRCVFDYLGKGEERESGYLPIPFFWAKKTHKLSSWYNYWYSNLHLSWSNYQIGPHYNVSKHTTSPLPICLTHIGQGPEG